ncbi:orotidine-5'-phosphate decarboxylase [Halorussus marinus]|uniref:orotidine-5'-phosphate decarboxylase n=1 Tax=Halorussus marinus TaxID=2505976 RepID=UPI0014306DAA|nr:orotidine-5'-phosphate decarboxylase [Halorussus marinus]
MTCFDRLRDRIRETGGGLAVGLNPERSRLPADCREYDYPRRAFTRRIVDATSDHAAAYTLNPAYYADADGRVAMAETVAYARGRGVPVILDGKWTAIRGSRVGLLDSMDAVTVAPAVGVGSGALGDEALARLRDTETAAFAVCRTPNAGASDLQALAVAGESDPEETVAERVASRVAERAVDAEVAIGLLVGGPSETLKRLRERAPDLPFLAVGETSNGPDIADYVTPDDAGEPGVGLVEAGREVIYAGEAPGAAPGRDRDRDADAYAAAARQAAGRLSRRL